MLKDSDRLISFRKDSPPDHDDVVLTWQLPNQLIRSALFGTHSIPQRYILEAQKTPMKLLSVAMKF